MSSTLSTPGIQAALLAGLLATTASAQVGSYTIIDIGDLAPPGESDGTNATGMNELGHVAAITGDGSGPLGFIPVLYRDGVLIDLGGLPGAGFGGGSKGVNNLDQVAGWSLNFAFPFSGMQSEPFIWTEGPGMVNPIDDEPTNWSGEAWDVNDAGQMVFTSVGGFWDAVTGFKRISFDGLTGFWKTWDLNEDGVVAGSAFGPSGQINAFRHTSATDTTTNLNDPVLDYRSDAYGLNDLGDVAGYATQLGVGREPMVWTADGQTLRLPIGDLGMFLTYCAAEHINNHGDVVGDDQSPGPSGTNPDLQPIGWVAFDVLDTSPVVKTDLLTLVDPVSAADWTRLHPFEINDRGEICGIGVAAALAGNPSGGARGFLMVPNSPDRFRNLSRSLSGVDGHPVAIAKGTLEAGTSLEIDLYKAAPSAVAFLAFGFDTLDAPFQGGVMVPDIFSPGGALRGIGGTSPLGGHSISTTWPVGIPADLELVAQYWIVDPAALFGLSASNAITQTTR